MNLEYEVYLEELLEGLKREYVETVKAQARYFSSVEAEKRDEILKSYFNEENLEAIVEKVSEKLLDSPTSSGEVEVLEVGVGSGFFTVKIAEKVKEKFSNVKFYAMDISPVMLRVAREKAPWATFFLGVAEDILKSLEVSRRKLELPERFDAIYSILTLHHCIDVERVLKSFRDALRDRGKAVIVDLCEHSFTEFKEEMGDLHLGFNPLQLKKESREILLQSTSGNTP